MEVGVSYCGAPVCFCAGVNPGFGSGSFEVRQGDLAQMKMKVLPCCKTHHPVTPRKLLIYIDL